MWSKTGVNSLQFIFLLGQDARMPHFKQVAHIITLESAIREVTVRVLLLCRQSLIMLKPTIILFPSFVFAERL